MSLTEFFRSIGAPNSNAGANDAEIAAAERRFQGRFPALLREWYLEANGFEGEAESCLWRMKSLQRLRTIPEIFPTACEITVSAGRHPARSMVGSHYVIFCDALIYLPFYAVNIRVDSPQYSEVVCASEEAPAKANLVASAFEAFAEILFHHADCALLPNQV